MHVMDLFDLLMTDISDLVRVAVVASTGNSDHSSLPAVISMAQAVANLCVSRNVFLKQKGIVIKFVVEKMISLGETSGLLTILLWFSMSMWLLVGHYPSTRISLVLMISEGVLKT